MKKNLAFVLALVMVVGSLFGVIPMAEGESQAPAGDPAYKSIEIAYANLNYTDKIEMMFAIPAYTDLPEGAVVNLIVWEYYDAGYAFSYKEAVSDSGAPVAILLEAEETKASINGKDHLVFVYDGLDASMMTDVIYARPAITLADGSRIYGDVMTYSIIEYVKSAKGEIDGIAGLENPTVIEALDKMLNFGAMAQVTSGDEYVPCGFLANEELSNVYIIPVVDGVAGERILAGFYKPGAEFASIYPPVDDIYAFTSILDSEGNVLSDESVDYSGIQIPAPESGDLEITMNFSRKTIFDSTLENAELGWYLDNKGTNVFDQAKAGQRVEMIDAKLSGNSGTGPAQGSRNFSSFVVINDPINPDSGDKVLRWTGVRNSALYFDGKNSPVYIRNGVPGFGDTIDPVVTIELVIAGYGKEAITTSNFRIRSDFKKADGSSAQCNLNIMKIESDVVKIGVAENKYEVLCSVSRDRYTKIAITIDFANETIKAYYAIEGEDYTKVIDSSLGSPSALATANGIVNESGDKVNKGYTSLLDWFFTAQSKIEWYGGNASGGITAAQLGSLKADMDGDGVEETPITADGTLDTINRDAFAKWYEDNRSMLVKDAKMFVGGVE